MEVGEGMLGDGEGEEGKQKWNWNLTVGFIGNLLCARRWQNNPGKKTCFTWIVSLVPTQALCQCYYPALTEKETDW